MAMGLQSCQVPVYDVKADIINAVASAIRIPGFHVTFTDETHPVRTMIISWADKKVIHTVGNGIITPTTGKTQ